MEETSTGFPCKRPQCQHREPFKSEQARRMHMVRVHTRAGQLGAKLGGKMAQVKAAKKKTSARSGREEFLAKKRAYNAKLRARFIAQGLTSTGKPRIRPKLSMMTHKSEMRPIVYPLPGTEPDSRITELERAFELGREYQKLLRGEHE